MDEIKSRVYILVDDQNRVTRIEGEYSLPDDLTGWILIDEGEPCDRLNLAQVAYLPRGLMDMTGCYLYKYVDSVLSERTATEIAADMPEPVTPEPTTEDDLMALAIDHEYRLTLLELGVE